jgi:hypothetical protein
VHREDEQDGEEPDRVDERETFRGDFRLSTFDLRQESRGTGYGITLR